MRVHLIASTILITALAQGAYAQSNGSSNLPSQTGSQTAQPTQSLPAEIKNKLTKDGFTNVTVVPGSFVVSAKDKNGDPVMMLIGPNSTTVLTAVQPQNQQSTTGSNASPDTSSSGSMTNPKTNSSDTSNK